MCRRHWNMVPQPLQAALYATYRRGQERDKKPSPAWVAAAARCRANVARQEGREAAAKYCDQIAQLADQRTLRVESEAEPCS